jgi:hypothetical protein
MNWPQIGESTFGGSFCSKAAAKKIFNLSFSKKVKKLIHL